jgi:hypothetical protein
MGINGVKTLFQKGKNPIYGITGRFRKRFPSRDFENRADVSQPKDRLFTCPKLRSS